MGALAIAIQLYVINLHSLSSWDNACHISLRVSYCEYKILFPWNTMKIRVFSPLPMGCSSIFWGVHSEATFFKPSKATCQKKKDWPALPSLAKVTQGKNSTYPIKRESPENHRRLKFVPFWGWDMWSFQRSYVYSLLHFNTFWTRLLFVGAALVEWSCGVAKCISWWANILHLHP